MAIMRHRRHGTRGSALHLDECMAAKAALRTSYEAHLAAAKKYHHDDKDIARAFCKRAADCRSAYARLDWILD